MKLGAAIREVLYRQVVPIDSESEPGPPCKLKTFRVQHYASDGIRIIENDVFATDWEQCEKRFDVIKVLYEKQKDS